MLACGEKRNSQLDNAAAIQLESFNGGSTNRTEPDQQCCIIAPRKMVAPRIPTRMIEPYQSFGGGVSAGECDSLTAIAARAREPKICQFVSSTVNSRNDVLDAQRRRADSLLR